MPSQPKALRDVVIDAYIAQGDNAGGDNHWSWNVVEELLGAPPDVLWPILLELIARAPDRQLGHIAAGPVEDFISRFGSRVIDAVEAQAAADPRFRRVLRGVWQLSMTDEVYARVVVASRPEERPTDADAHWPDDVPEADRFLTHKFDLAVPGPPPGVGDADESTTRARLLEALKAVPSVVALPFAGPVFMEIVLELEPGSPSPDPATVVRSIVDGLAPAAYPSVEDVWEVRLDRLGAKESRYRVTVVQMSSYQVEGLTDAADLFPEGLMEPETTREQLNAWFESEFGPDLIRDHTIGEPLDADPIDPPLDADPIDPPSSTT